jgi:hypothetical protein
MTYSPAPKISAIDPCFKCEAGRRDAIESSRVGSPQHSTAEAAPKAIEPKLPVRGLQKTMGRELG